LVGRDKKDSKEQREKLLADVAEQQRLAEQGLKPAICIFPEGATTNGEYLLEFKRGAFLSLHSVKPYY
jgi:lysophosphatidylcholine acyltransferase/lyso-PAF acetyltransferase